MTAPHGRSADRIVALIGLSLLAIFAIAVSGGRAPSTTAVATAKTASESEYRPPIAEASGDAERAIASIKLEPGFRASLFAAEPMLGNPVGFWFDGPSRCYVAETFRQETKGVPDNRSHPEWLDDDLASQTIDDRRRMYLKHHPEYAVDWTKDHDRIRLVIDTDGTDRADKSVVFADGYNDILDGTGAAVLVRGGDVYYTCIPQLSLLRDKDGDLRADERQDLFRGFGVRIALRGHDLHGLRIGPDGRLWFSCGDRGYTVETREGETLSDPKSGAIFRCELDGSNLEVFATGLRNPQDIAFDDYGNLFTGDNNGDGGDHARFVYVVEGGDTGWRMNYQYIDERGPWVKERWAWPRFENQAAFHIPPIALVGNGPSGLVHEPGTTLPERHRGRFLLCDFTGGRDSSGIHSIALEQRGAGFAVTKDEWLVRGVLATDCDIDSEGALCISDWVESWEGVGKGRIYKVRHGETLASDLARETATILRAGFEGRQDFDLIGLLGHADQRVRQETQFELAARGESVLDRLRVVAFGKDVRLARIHALWALEQIARRGEVSALSQIVDLLADDDAEIRAQAARLIAERRIEGTQRELLIALGDGSARVRYFAALALGRVGDWAATDGLRSMLRENDERDVFLRHAGVMAVAGISERDPRLINVLKDDPSYCVRLVALLAMRRMGDPRLEHFLVDHDPRIVVEAARAVWDRPLDAAFSSLAERLEDASRDAALLRRAIAANEQLGRREDAARLARFFADATRPEAMRLFAAEAIARFNRARTTEPVWNDHRPRPAHDGAVMASALDGVIGEVVASAPIALRAKGIGLVATYRLTRHYDAVLAAAMNVEVDANVRVAALDALELTKHPALEEAAILAMKSSSPRVRARAAGAMAAIPAERALSALTPILADGSTAERQAAMTSLGRLGDAGADEVILAWFERMVDGTAPGEILLEISNAARRRAAAGAAILKDRLTAFDASFAPEDVMARRKACIEGGDAKNGERIFRESSASCMRCHSLDGSRPEQAGPDLGDVGRRIDRRAIYEAILLPNKTIAAGFQRETIGTTDGELLDARVLGETDDALEIEVTRYGRTETMKVERARIAERRHAKSAMPEDVGPKLSDADLRDLIEFLVSRRERDAVKH